MIIEDCPVCIPKASLRECLDICVNDGGFSTVIRCVNKDEIIAKFIRSGSPDLEDYQFDLRPVKCSGDTFTFALPVEFWSYPIGYYDANIYQGDQFIRTIRISLYTSSNTGKTKVLESLNICGDKSLPNTEDVVECGKMECPEIEPCEPTVTRIGNCC